MKREDIKIAFESPGAHDRRRAQAEATVGADAYRRAERGIGAFRRAFTLPATIDGARIAAGYHDGVLTVTLPRREESMPRQIQVNG